VRLFILVSFWLYALDAAAYFSYVMLNQYPRAPHSRIWDLINFLVVLYLGVWGGILLWAS
jgi:hypothetical protein